MRGEGERVEGLCGFMAQKVEGGQEGVVADTDADAEADAEAVAVVAVLVCKEEERSDWGNCEGHDICFERSLLHCYLLNSEWVTYKEYTLSRAEKARRSSKATRE